MRIGVQRYLASLAMIGLMFASAAARAQVGAQIDAQIVTPLVPPDVLTASAAAVTPATKPSGKPRECTRLPLSDIHVGKDETIRVARIRLDEYIAKVGKRRGWRSWDKSRETISCEDYLYIPLLGQEYKCFVTATFCRSS